MCSSHGDHLNSVRHPRGVPARQSLYDRSEAPPERGRAAGPRPGQVRQRASASLGWTVLGKILTYAVVQPPKYFGRRFTSCRCGIEDYLLQDDRHNDQGRPVQLRVDDFHLPKQAVRKKAVAAYPRRR